MAQDPLSWLFSLEQFGIKLGLHNIRALLDALANPERTFTSVHVAGTNGKGSVTAMVDAALRAAGHRSGRYTSPHLIDITERIVIDGNPVDRAMLVDAVGDIRGVVEQSLERGGLQAMPTFFEVTTAAAFHLFRRAGVEVATCEVGLGGRLDATNVLEPAVAAITSIGFDHQRYLGNTLREIASEKAGIIKPRTPVVVGPMAPEALRAISLVAEAQEAELINARAGVTAEEIQQSERFLPARIALRTPARNYGEVTLALAGDHQVENAIVAVRILETLQSAGVDVPAAAVVESLTRVAWPGRLDFRCLPDGRQVLLDAAHNPDGAGALAQFLIANHSEQQPIVFAAMHDKDAEGLLRRLAPVASAFVLTRASNARSTDPSALFDIARAVAPETALIVEPVPRDALAAAWRISPTIIVAGSIFLLGDVMGLLGGS
jgi:dihydrofolate synthase/folylpolyglutamate synthase